MPTPTYTPLANTTLTIGVDSVVFSNISQIYKDIILVISAISNTGTINLCAQVNNDTGSTSYTNIAMYGDGTSAGSFHSAGQNRFDLGVGSGTTTNALTTVTNFADYSSTNKQKSMLSRSNEPTYAGATAGRWASTSAITSIKIFSTTANIFAPGSSFALYGIVG